MQRVLTVGIGLALLAGCRGNAPLSGAAPAAAIPRGATLIGLDAGTLVGVDAGSMAASGARSSPSCLAQRVHLPAAPEPVRGQPLPLAVEASVTGLRIDWSASAGTLSSPSGPEVAWTVPDGDGSFTAQALVTSPAGETLTLTWVLSSEGTTLTLAAPTSPPCP
ncbi:MAG: hypothetical protein VKQ33_05830 [Candidatus Sericytochromatia bacterium]|nr:hypothetical protein [Candidatus Sericytochromatia bacterium]